MKAAIAGTYTYIRIGNNKRHNKTKMRLSDVTKCTVYIFS